MISFRNYNEDELSAFLFEEADYTFDEYELGEEDPTVLKFSEGNDKIPFPILNLPSGWYCPFAEKCKAKVVRIKGSFKTTGMPQAGERRVVDSDTLVVRCYAASDEARYPNLYKQVRVNSALLKQCNSKLEIAKLIEKSIVYYKIHEKHQNIRYVRLHGSGDFYSQDYLDAWIAIAKKYPDIIFYGYTKSLPYLVKRLPLPNNFRLVASYGGTADDLIDKYNLKYVAIVYSEEEAHKLGLEIDNDDSHAYDNSKGSFALVVHGSQPAGSELARIVKRQNSIPVIEPELGNDFEFPEDEDDNI